MKKAGSIACAAVLLLAGVFLLYRLGQEPLQDYDEATYAEVVHEALASGHVLSYTEGGVPFVEKPPLGFWTMELSEGLLGEHAFAMRLPFAIFGVAAIAALMLLVFEVSGSWWAAALGGAILATTPPFMEAARQVRLDVPLLFFIIAAAYCFVRGLQNPKWLPGFGAMLGLAILAKSVVAVFALAAAALLLLLHRRFGLLQNKYLYYGAALCVAIAAPWHLWEWAHFGSAFWSRYIGFNIIDRARQNLFWTVTLTNADYIAYLQQFTQPWLAAFFAALAGVAAGWRWTPPANRRFVAASAGTIAVIIAVFFMAKTKAPTYLLPAYPFAAAAIAIAFASIRPRLWQVAAGVISVLLLLSAAQETYRYAYHSDPYFSIVMAQARDEYAIAEIIKQLPKIEPVYAYDGASLGSIAYYSQHFELEKLAATSSPAGGALLLVDTPAIAQFAKAFPDISTRPVYQGRQMSLFEVVRED